MTTTQKVMIVEDDISIYRDLSFFFEDRGFHIVGSKTQNTLADYEEAIELIQEIPIDLAVLDINLGKKDKNGLDVAEYISKYSNIPVIMLSAHFNEHYRELAREYSHYFVTKPYTTAQLEVAYSWIKPILEKNRKIRETGSFLKVREGDIVRLQAITEGTSFMNEFDYTEKRINWNEIYRIRTHTKNHILLYHIDQKKGYLVRNSLSKLATVLPDHFVRFDKFQLINIYLVQEQVSQRAYRLYNQTFIIQPDYSVSAKAKLRWLFLK